MMELTRIVSREEDGRTLEAFLRGPLSLSMAQSRAAKQAGGISVNGAPRYANQRVYAGEVVRVALPGYAGEAQAPIAPPPPVYTLYEDGALIAVFKPAPLQCHPSPSAPGGSDTLEARVCAALGAPAHPVHRLDAETRGVVLFAKLPYAQARLQRQMAEGGFEKTYLAWAFGTPRPAAGEIDAPIARLSPESFTRVVRADGQRAVTRYETVYTAALPGGGSASLVALSPVTGRTHQLRVHMAHIGCPLLGDARYASEASRAASAALALPFHQLCAVRLRFFHPVTDEAVEIACAPEFDLSL